MTLTKPASGRVDPGPLGSVAARRMAAHARLL